MVSRPSYFVAWSFSSCSKDCGRTVANRRTGGSRAKLGETMKTFVSNLWNRIKSRVGIVVGGLALVASPAVSHAADYTDVAAAQTAMAGIPTTASPIFLGFVTLAVGAFGIRVIARLSKRGLSVA